MKSKSAPPLIAVPDKTNADISRPTRAEAEAAVHTLLLWAGDNPKREGLKQTPQRVVQAFKEWFNGYSQDPADFLCRTFTEVDGYDETILLRDILFESCCEHHISPITGKAHVAYIPNGRIVGISKIAHVVEIFSRRLQLQEKLTAQIADTLHQSLQPRGVAVVIEATHHCMTSRGTHKPGVVMVTSRMTGIFRDDPAMRRELLSLIGPIGGA